VTSFVQPLLYLLVFGSGLATTIRAGATGTNNFKIFLLPGVIAMTTLFTSMFAAVSITWDREFGFLKEILVAPVSRTSVVLAKAFGGATTSAMQGLAVLVFAPVVGMHLSALRILAVAPMLVVMALAVNALGLVMASRVATMQGFMVIMNFITLPLYFLSGALFPLTTAPAWLRTIGYFDPVSYAVDAIRRTLIPAYPAFLHLHVRSWVPPVPVEIAILAAFASLMFVLAVRGFERQP
jgi:ABC-2 type transport system permease protein